MLIIDINKQKVQNNPSFDLDVIVLKGASNDLINSLAALSTAPTIPTNTCCGHNRKVSLGGRTARTSSCTPQSTTVESNGQFNLVFEKISEALNGVKPASANRSYRVSETFQHNVATRKTLQTRLAKALISDAKFVEYLRGAAQIDMGLNPSGHTVTTRNIHAAIALYVYYSDDRSFTSAEGVSAVYKHVQVSTDTIARLATELHCLHRGAKKTQYFVTRGFGQMLLNVIRTPRFATLRNTVDKIQDQIDGLGSI